jgi:hypothetical protein
MGYLSVKRLDEGGIQAFDAVNITINPENQH